MLELKNIYKTYKSKKGTNCIALKGIDIKFPDTGMVFILGKSGSGKSTLLNIIGGLDAPDKGEIIIQGSSTKNFTRKDYDSYRNTYLGFIFQEFNVLDNFTIYDNVALALRLQNKKAEKTKVRSILKEVGLEGFENRKPNEISGGQKQRVAVARALVKDPKIIFGDEPTGNLDSNTSKQVFNLLTELAKTRLVVIVSHDRDSAERYADRIIELADGNIINDVEKVRQNHDDFEITSENIFVPSNRALTLSEIRKINKAQQEKSFVIKQTKKSSFKKTVEKESSQKDGFKLIKSRLPNKYATQIGISNFKSKPFRLVFTILLTMVSLALFGLSQNFATYDLPNASVRSFENNQIDEIVLKQGEYVDEYDSFNYTVESIILPDNLNKINEQFPNLVYDKGYGLNLTFGVSSNSNQIMSLILKMFGQSVTSPYITYTNGVVFINENNFSQRLSKILGCEVEIIGNMPLEEDDYGVAVTDYFVDALIDCGSIVILEKNGDGFIDYKDLVVENEEYELKDAFGFPFKIKAVIKTDYKERYKDLIESYDMNPNDFSEQDDYADFSNMVLNNYSVFYTGNKDFYSYIQRNYASAKATRFKFKNYSSDKYFEEGSFETYETGYMFRKSGMETYLQSLITDDAQRNDFYNSVFSNGLATFDLLTSTNSTNGIIISLKEYNRMFNTQFETLSEFNAYFYDEQREDENDVIDLAFFKMLSMENKVREIQDLKIVGVFDINTTTLLSYPQLYASYSSISAFVGDELCQILNDDNFGIKALYVDLPDSTFEKEEFLRLADSSYLYHVSEISSTLYMVDEIFDIFSLIFQWVALILAVFSVILLFNFVTLSVVNKQKDIGILRAIGTKGTDVSKIFLIETLIMGMITTVLSWGLIFLGTNLVNSLLFNGFKSYLQSSAIEKIALLSVGFRPIVAVLIACLFVTLIATIIPTIKISRMKPIDAIKKSN